MRCLQSGACRGSFELQPRVIFHKEASGARPRALVAGLGGGGAGCAAAGLPGPVCVYVRVWQQVCVCVCVFTSVEGEVQSAPMWSSPALPCILGNPITPSAVSLSSASSP